jgi:formate hydrogenlyase transcriptional activator
MAVSPKGASCGTAIYRREPVYATDILTDPIWDDYRHLVLPYGIRSVWSRPLFASDGKALGTFAILYREVRSPGTTDLTLIENASDVTRIAIERHIPMLHLWAGGGPLDTFYAKDGGPVGIWASGRRTRTGRP